MTAPLSSSLLPLDATRRPLRASRAPAMAVVVLGFVASVSIMEPARAFGPPDAPGDAVEVLAPVAGFARSSGTVRRYLVNEFGDVQGIVSDEHIVVRFPPHMGADVVDTLKPGDAYVAEGDRQGDEGFHAYTLGKVGSPPLIESRPRRNATPAAPRGVRAASLVPLTVAGTIAALVRGPGGDVDGIVLDDGTDIWLPPRNGVTVAVGLRVGGSVAASGYGTRNRFGCGLRAEQIGFAGQPLRPLQPEGPKEPPRPPQPPRPPG